MGTLQDLERQGIQLQEGLLLTLYTDDADDQGQPDELRAEGVVHYDGGEQCWAATIDWAAIRHASDEAAEDARQSEGSGAVAVAFRPNQSTRAKGA